MEAWFKEYVIPDKDGIACDAGAGQVRPIGIKWDDGTDAFVYAAVKKAKKIISITCLSLYSIWNILTIQIAGHVVNPVPQETQAMPG